MARPSDHACALTRAASVQATAADLGFDWAGPEGALEKVREETNEVAALVAHVPGGTAAHATGGLAAHVPGGMAADVPDRPAADATGPHDPRRLVEEVGDLLFAAVNVARLADIDPAPALERATAKFERRFAEVERIARRRGLPMPGTGLAALDRIWDEVKSRER